MGQPATAANGEGQVPREKPRLHELIGEDWRAHGRDWTRPGFRAVTLCRIGKLQRDSPRRLVRRLVKRVHPLLYRRVRNVYGIELPWTVELGRRVIFEHQGGVVIHGYAHIGEDSVIRHGVTIGNRHDERPFDAPRLGARVNVGAGAAVLGAVEIGDGARIGANAVVLHDVPPAATVAGVPAILVREDRGGLSLSARSRRPSGLDDRPAEDHTLGG